MKDREKEIYEFIYSYFPNETTGKGRWPEIYSVMKFLYNKHQQIKSVEKNESPDFIVTFKSGEKIGIEITQIWKDNKKDNKEIGSMTRVFIKAEEIFKSKYPTQKIHVRFICRNNRIRFKKGQLDKIAEEIADYVNDYINNIDHQLPEYIRITNVKPHSCVSFTQTMCWFPEDIAKIVIEEKIKSKEKKLLQYNEKQTDIHEFWLIMTIRYDPTSYYIDDCKLDSPINSDFHKVFLYRDLDEKTIVLK